MKQAGQINKVSSPVVDLTILKAQCWDLSKEMIRARDKATAMANRLAELNKMIEEAEQPIFAETHQDKVLVEREV